MNITTNERILISIRSGCSGVGVGGRGGGGGGLYCLSTTSKIS